MNYYSIELYAKMLFFIISALIVASIHCEVFINEVNVVDPKQPAKNEFIELMSTVTDIPLRGYKIIGFSCQSTSGTIDLIITLWNNRIDKNGFFTVGDVSSANLKVPSDYIKFKSDFVGKQISGNFFRQKEVRAIGLLHDKTKLNSFSDFILSKKQPNIKINDAIVNQLKDYLIDLVVYGDNACEKCSLFEKIIDDFVTKKYILREYPKKNEPKKVVSLNRCAVESSGFLPEKFKLGNPTPGIANDCTGPHILLENIVPANVYSDDFDDTEEASCSLQPTSACAANQSDENIEEEIQMLNETAVKDTCTTSMSYPDGANIASNINQENARKRQIGVDYSMDLEWQSTKYFRLVTKCQNFFFELSFIHAITILVMSGFNKYHHIRKI